MTKWKGPVFPSHVNAVVREKKVWQWKSGAQSTRQQMRNLRHKAAPILNSKDPETFEVGKRVIQACLDEPELQFGSLHLICAGIDLADETGAPWADCMTSILNKFDMEIEAHRAKTAD